MESSYSMKTKAIVKSNSAFRIALNIGLIFTLATGAFAIIMGGFPECRRILSLQSQMSILRIQVS